MNGSPPPDTTFGRVVIVGVGLLGGSLGLALRARRLADSVVGVGRRESSLQIARARGCVTDVSTDLFAAVTEADLVVLCPPVASIAEVASSLVGRLPARAVVTDVGSVKGPLIDQIAKGAAGLPFVGSHPMAGGTQTGAEAARDDLFDGATTIITPTAATRDEWTDRVTNLWRAVGSRSVTMSPEDHDRAVAIVSHLPHIAAAALASVPSETDLACVGRGFRDTTRIAAGDVDLWRQILTLNRDPVLAAIDQFQNHLTRWRSALDGTGEADLSELLTRGKRIRDALAD